MSCHFFDLYNEADLLGAGNFGRIYSVEEKAGGRVYACKEIFLPKLPNDLVEAQHREITLLKGIQHPNIVPIDAAYYEEEHIYILMPVFRKGDLSVYRKRRHLAEHDIFVILMQLLQALAFLHGARGNIAIDGIPYKIIHRDIKPANVLMSEESVIVLTDFGLSKVLDNIVSTQTIAGSLAYIAPEMHARTGYTEAVDIWSLGVTIYELLSDGKPLINAFFSNRILEEIKQWQRPLSIPNASEELAFILNSMLSPDPAERPSALELLSMPILQSVRRSFLEEGPLGPLRAQCLQAYLQTTLTTYLSDLDADGHNIIMRCIRNGTFHLVSDMADYFRGRLDSKGQTALMIAAKMNDAGAVKELLKTRKGVCDEKRMTDMKGRTALMCAAEMGDTHVEVVSLLKEAEAKMVTSERWSAMMFAAAGGYSLAVSQLLDSEARMVNNTGQTALMIAAAANKQDVVRVLLKYEAKRKDSNGKTALMYAAMNGHTECVSLLAKYEAKLRDKDKMTALAHAIMRRHTATATLLIPLEENILIKRKSCYRMAIESNMKDIINCFSRSLSSSSVAAHIDLDKSDLSVATFSSISSVSTSMCELSCSMLDSRVCRDLNISHAP